MPHCRVRLLTVKTLAAVNPDPFYGKTRAFYEAVGNLPDALECRQSPSIDDQSAPMTAALPVAADRRQLATLDQLAAIPEEEIWLAKQKSRQTRRAYRLDVRHFMRALGITSTDMLRQGRSSRRHRLGRDAARGGESKTFDHPPPACGAVQPVQASGETRGGGP
jgi:hypothetical protein